MKDDPAMAKDDEVAVQLNIQDAKHKQAKNSAAKVEKRDNKTTATAEKSVSKNVAKKEE